MHLSAWETATLEQENKKSFKNQLTNFMRVLLDFKYSFFTESKRIHTGSGGSLLWSHLKLEVDVPAGRTIGGIIIAINIIIVIIIIIFIIIIIITWNLRSMFLPVGQLEASSSTSSIIIVIIIIIIITWNLRSMFLPVGQSEARLAGLAHEARLSPRLESAIWNFL